MKKHFQSNAHLWKKVAIAAFLLTQATSFFLNGNGFSWSYPLKEVAKNSDCRKSTWSEMSADCKEPLPIIHGANYAAYKNDIAYTSIYTTLRGAPYSDGWAAGQGAHEGVDIVSAEGTPVYAVEDGLVIRARAQAGYGNVVMIKHTLPDGKIVYSIYGHLKLIYAMENGNVKEGDLIGTVGNEGFSFGNHLLWDINITATNTYAFRGCPAYGNGTTFNAIENIVDNGLCRDFLLQRTTDPIAWIESQGGTLALGNNSLPSLSNLTTKKRMPMVPLGPTTVTTVTTTPLTTIAAAYSQNTTPTPTKAPAVTTPTPIKTTTQKSLASLSLLSKDSATNEVAFAAVDSTKTASTFGTTMELNNASKLGEDFLNKYTITVSPSFRNTMNVGQSSSIVISIADKNGKPFIGALPKDLTIIPSQGIIALSPQVIRATDSRGVALVLVSAKQAGNTDLIVSYNMKSLAKISLTIKQ